MDTSRLTKLSINEVFDFYSGSPKKFFNISIIYILFWGAISLSIAIPILLAMWYAGIGKDFLPIDDHDAFSIFSNPLYLLRFTNFISAVSIMNIPIFGIFLIENNTLDGNIKLQQIFSHFKKKHWRIWILLLLAINLFYIITFHVKIAPLGYDAHDYNFTALYNLDNRWPDLMLELFKDYLPFFSAMMFTTMYYANYKTIKESILKYKNAFFASLVISFVIQSLMGSIVGFYRTYVSTLLFEIPFLDNVFPIILGGIIQLAFFAYMFSAVAISFTVPFAHLKKNLVENKAQPEADIL